MSGAEKYPLFGLLSLLLLQAHPPAPNQSSIFLYERFPIVAAIFPIVRIFTVTQDAAIGAVTQDVTQDTSAQKNPPTAGGTPFDLPEEIFIQLYDKLCHKKRGGYQGEVVTFSVLPLHYLGDVRHRGAESNCLYLNPIEK